jgi:hypothetical protein
VLAARQQAPNASIIVHSLLPDGSQRAMYKRNDTTFGYPGYPDISSLNATLIQPPFRDTYHVNRYLRELFDGQSPFEDVTVINCSTNVFLMASGLFNRTSMHQDLIHPLQRGEPPMPYLELDSDKNLSERVRIFQ